MFEAIRKKPTKGDWARNALDLVKKFELNLTLNEIRDMSTSSFKKLAKTKMTELAFKELQNRQQGGKKGKLINYYGLKMADYLLPGLKQNLQLKQVSVIFIRN